MRKLEEKYDNFDKLKALAKFLKIEVSDEDEFEDIIDVDRNGSFTYDGEEYRVLDDKEADEAFNEYQQEIWDEMGLESFAESARQYIVNNYVDDKQYFRDIESAIEDMIIESPDSYVSFFNIDEIKKDLTKMFKKRDSKLLDWLDSEGIELMNDEDDTEYVKEAEEFLDNMNEDETIEAIVYLEKVDDYSDDAVAKYLESYDTAYDYLEEMLGGEVAEITKMLSDYIDTDAVFEYIKENDGRGSSLSGYDGNEEESEGYFIYRTN